MFRYFQEKKFIVRLAIGLLVGGFWAQMGGVTVFAIDRAAEDALIRIEHKLLFFKAFLSADETAANGLIREITGDIEVALDNLRRGQDPKGLIQQALDSLNPRAGNDTDSDEKKKEDAAHNAALEKLKNLFGAKNAKGQVVPSGAGLTYLLDNFFGKEGDYADFNWEGLREELLAYLALKTSGTGGGISLGGGSSSALPPPDNSAKSTEVKYDGGWLGNPQFLKDIKNALANLGLGGLVGSKIASEGTGATGETAASASGKKDAGKEADILEDVIKALEDPKNAAKLGADQKAALQQILAKLRGKVAWLREVGSASSAGGNAVASAVKRQSNFTVTVSAGVAARIAAIQTGSVLKFKSTASPSHPNVYASYTAGDSRCGADELFLQAFGGVLSQLGYNPAGVLNALKSLLGVKSSPRMLSSATACVPIPGIGTLKFTIKAEILGGSAATTGAKGGTGATGATGAAGPGGSGGAVGGGAAGGATETKTNTGAAGPTGSTGTTGTAGAGGTNQYSSVDGLTPCYGDAKNCPNSGDKCVLGVYNHYWCSNGAPGAPCGSSADCNGGRDCSGAGATPPNVCK